MTDDPIRRLARAAELNPDEVRPLFDRSTRLVKARVVREIDAVQKQLDAARREAERLRTEARAEAEAIREEARRAGREEGWQTVLEHLAVAERAKAEARAGAEREMVELAFGLAERILGRALDRDAVFGELVARHLEHARGAPSVTVRAHPTDVERLRADHARLATIVDGVPLRLEPDPSLRRGDCVIDTDRGRIDARIQTQLEDLRSIFSGEASDE